MLEGFLQKHPRAGPNSPIIFGFDLNEFSMKILFNIH
jgi:hypothetical protein